MDRNEYLIKAYYHADKDEIVIYLLRNGRMLKLEDFSKIERCKIEALAAQAYTRIFNKNKILNTK